LTRDTIYTRLRDIGCSVETADATAEALEGMNDRKVEAFMLWAMGMEQAEAAKAAGIGLRSMERILYLLRKHSFC